MTQGALFRLSDPSTSRKAGERAAHGYTGLKADIVDLLERLPGGATRRELADMLERQTGKRQDLGTVSRRLTDLRDIHHAVREAGERDGMTVWAAA